MLVPPARITGIEWLRIVPVLHFRDAVRAAWSVQALVPVIVAMFLAGQGQRLIDRSLAVSVANQAASVSPGESAAGISRPGLASDAIPRPLRTPVLALWQWLSCARSMGGHWLATMVWQCAVWSLFGLAICRSSAEADCHDRRTGVIRSCRFAVQHWRTVLGVLAVSAAMLLLFRFPFTVAAWLSGVGERQIGWLVPIRDVLLLVSLFAGFVLAISGTLAIAAAAVDQCTSADALSRCVSYVLSHKLRTLTQVILILLGMTVLRVAIGYVLDIGVACVANLEARTGGVPSAGRSVSLLSMAGMRNRLPDVFAVAFFWAGTTVSYRLLRCAEDDIRMDEMHEDNRRLTRSESGP